MEQRIAESRTSGELDLSKLRLQELPELPQNIWYLNCSKNNLTRLSELPPNLQALECSRNNLTVLPALPDSLEELVCDFNQLATLPKQLPPNLQLLELHYNQITALPELPNTLISLQCGFNKLRTLPKLPDSLQALDIRGNDFEPRLQTLVGSPEVQEALRAMNEYESEDAAQFVVQTLNRYYDKKKAIRNMARNVGALNTVTRKTGSMVMNTKNMNVPKNVVVHIGSFFHNEKPKPNLRNITLKLKEKHNAVTRKRK